jgi:hypothetical protein
VALVHYYLLGGSAVGESFTKSRPITRKRFRNLGVIFVVVVSYCCESYCFGKVIFIS